MIFVRERCSSVDFWGYCLIVYKLIVIILCLVASIVRVQIHKSRTGASPSYTDLLVCGTGFGVGFAAFGFLFVTDPGLQFALVSISLILLVSIILVLLFGKQVLFHCFHGNGVSVKRQLVLCLFRYTLYGRGSQRRKSNSLSNMLVTN